MTTRSDPRFRCVRVADGRRYGWIIQIKGLAKTELHVMRFHEAGAWTPPTLRLQHEAQWMGLHHLALLDAAIERAQRYSAILAAETLP